MQQDNNIENKLRELEDEQLPDLSNMDAHWQQMAAMLQPVAAPVKQGWPKWMMNTLSVAAVAVMIGGAMWYLSSQKQPGNTVAVQTANSPQIEKETAAIAVSDTSGNETVDAVSTVAPVQGQQQTNEVTDFTADAGGSIFDSLKINFTDCNTCPSKQTGNIVETSAERKMMLQQFFGQLEKPAQQFIIDNNRDTLLQFEEGTALLIPAQSFGGMNGVEITAKEFYKRSDIILNQLHTASNKEQLITGGMLQLNANYKGNALQVTGKNALTLFMADTSVSMADMRMFNGGATTNQSGQTTNIDWILAPQYFVRRKVITMVKALNIVDQPYRVKQTAKGEIGYFFYDRDDLKIDKENLKRILKEKYGYYKVKLRDGIVEVFGVSTSRIFNREYATRIGSVVWMEKEVADKYKLNVIEKKLVVKDETSIVDLNNIIPSGKSKSPDSINTVLTSSEQANPGLSKKDFNLVASDIKSKYSVNLSKLGWINCDRFYSDKREKASFRVNIGDSAMNYYTVLVFENFKSMMTGTIHGSRVVFQNIPIGEPVKVISIGINKNGETVYSVTSATTGMEELTGIHFESTSASNLKTALSKMDQ